MDNHLIIEVQIPFCNSQQNANSWSFFGNLHYNMTKYLYEKYINMTNVNENMKVMVFYEISDIQEVVIVMIKKLYENAQEFFMNKYNFQNSKLIFSVSIHIYTHMHATVSKSRLELNVLFFNY